MAAITLTGVGVTLGANRLFSDVSLGLPPGRRVALVGGNGVGKTTLLKVVVGLLDPDEGTVSRPRGARIGWLPQDVVDAVGTSGTVLAHVLEGAAHVTALEAELRDLEQRIETADAADQERLLATYATVQHRFEQLGGYGIEAEAHRVLAGLGFAPGDAQRPTTELSGGWRVRVALARLLLSRPDLLVLDEPTNHLDLWACESLEEALREFAGTCIVVSHDRYFLNQVVDLLIVLDGDGHAQVIHGNYDTFELMRAQQIETARDKETRRQGDKETRGQEAPPSAAPAGKVKRKSAVPPGSSVPPTSSLVVFSLPGVVRTPIQPSMPSSSTTLVSVSVRLFPSSALLLQVRPMR